MCCPPASERFTPPTAPPSHSYTETLAELCRIHLPQTNLAIAKRSADSDISRYLSSWGSQKRVDGFRSAEITIRRGEIEAIDQLASELPGGTESTVRGVGALLQDIKRLAGAFLAVSHAEGAKIELSFIDTDMCRLFHADNVDLRLLCTYCGKGTQWLAESDADRSGLGKGCNANICRHPEKIRHMDTFDVALLKGSRYPGNKQFGAIHRSPPIVGTDKPWRVMLKIDEIDKPHPIRSMN